MILLAEHRVPAQTPPTRLSDYAREVFAEWFSRKGIKKAIKQGAVLLDDRRGYTGDWVLPGQTLRLLDLAWKKPKALALSLPIIYEDEELAVIHKPAGIPVSGNQYRTIQNTLLYNLKASTAKNALPWPQAAHRLDALTSGLLLIGKTRPTLQHLGRLFEEKQVHKTYTAVVVGAFSPAEGTWTTEIDGKAARTDFKCLSCQPSLRFDWLSTLHLFPQTGRTHQIRRHLAQATYPILGDQLYGRDGKILKGKGLFLAATGLQFSHPTRSEMMNFEISPPAKFASFVARKARRAKRFGEASTTNPS
ncbi:MAG: RluA family pseudouridine synthase [Bacteroidota bacterium]